MEKDRVIQFRLRCADKGSPYYTIRIFPGKPAMQAWASKHNPEESHGYADTEAAVHAYRRLQLDREHWVVKSDIGWVVFYSGHVGAGIVSHEMTHAALYYLKFCRPQLFRVLLTSRKADECLAWVQGWLVAQFWTKFYRAKRGRPRATGTYGKVRSP